MKARHSWPAPLESKKPLPAAFEPYDKTGSPYDKKGDIGGIGGIDKGKGVAIRNHYKRFLAGGERQEE